MHTDLKLSSGLAAPFMHVSLAGTHMTRHWSPRHSVTLADSPHFGEEEVLSWELCGAQVLPGVVRPASSPCLYALASVTDPPHLSLPHRLGTWGARCTLWRGVFVGPGYLWVSGSPACVTV